MKEIPISKPVYVDVDVTMNEDQAKQYVSDRANLELSMSQLAVSNDDRGRVYIRQMVQDVVSRLPYPWDHFVVRANWVPESRTVHIELQLPEEYRQ